MKRTIYLYDKPTTPRPPSKHLTSQKRPNFTSDYYFAINEKREGILQNFKTPRDLVPGQTRLIL